MTDLELFKRTTPEEELVALAFSRWQENMRIGTHAEGCHAWGMNHYECAQLRITELEAQLADAQKDAALCRAALELVLQVFEPCKPNYIFSKRLALTKAREVVSEVTHPKEQP